MNESMQNFFSQMRSTFEWVPDWMIAGVVVVVAILIALWAHKYFVRFGSQATRNANPFWRSLFEKTAGPSKLAFILLGLSAVLPFAPGLGSVFFTLFSVALIVLAGWVAINAAEMGFELYMQGSGGPARDDVMSRRHETQMRLLKRAASVVIIVITAGFALSTFMPVAGSSMFALIGIAAIAAAFAARPILANMIAGLLVAMTQPFRIDDTVDIDGQSGKVEDITYSHVVLRLNDQRQVLVPLYYFMEKPYQNLTREGSEILGRVSIQTDYSVPVERVRQKLSDIVKHSPEWDGQIANLEVTDAKEGRLELRATVSARTSRKAWDLSCNVREKLISFLQREHPQALPGSRAPVSGAWA